MDHVDDAHEARENRENRDNTAPLSFTERLRGRRTRDIRLPMEAGSRRDAKLAKPSPGEAIREGLDVVRDLARGGRPKPPGARRPGRVAHRR